MPSDAAAGKGVSLTYSEGSNFELSSIAALKDKMLKVEGIFTDRAAGTVNATWHMGLSNEAL